MRSTSGEHFIALDHVRAVAAFLVFSWHFLHNVDGSPIAFEFVPSVPLAAIVNQGHTGVALFMTLSGYLFAKLIGGADGSIHYPSFLWNRAIRLLPLLVVVMALAAMQVVFTQGDLRAFALSIVKGPIFPTLPNGGWSITVEAHFYLLLPLLLYLLRRSPWALAATVVMAIGARLLLHAIRGEVQTLGYLTLVGRYDQFVLGILAYHLRASMRHRHLIVGSIIIAFAGFWWLMNSLSGSRDFLAHPSPSGAWAFVPTIEGATYGALIAWYDGSFAPPRRGLSRLIGRLGAYSYSIYLLHFFVVFHAVRAIETHVMPLFDFYVAMAWSLVAYVAMLPIGWLSFRFIESPFLRYRRRYVIAAAPALCNAGPASLRSPEVKEEGNCTQHGSNVQPSVP